MDGISNGWLAGAMAYAPSQVSALPSQPSQAIIIPPNVAQNKPGLDNNTQVSNSANAASVQVSQANSTQSTNTDRANTAQQDQQQRQQEQQVQQVLSQLKARDQEVRTHEQAHLAAAGQYATGGIKYEYQTGPDGRKYAIGGSVGIDTAPIAGDPQATMQKAMVVQRAALAPAQPSSQDMRVAAQASQMMMEAQSQMRTQQFEGDDSESEVDAENRAEQGMDKQAQPNGYQIAERNDFEVRISLQQTAANNDPYRIQSAG